MNRSGLGPGPVFVSFSRRARCLQWQQTVDQYGQHFRGECLIYRLLGQAGDLWKAKHYPLWSGGYLPNAFPRRSVRKQTPAYLNHRYLPIPIYLPMADLVIRRSWQEFTTDHDHIGATSQLPNSRCCIVRRDRHEPASTSYLGLRRCSAATKLFRSSHASLDEPAVLHRTSTTRSAPATPRPPLPPRWPRSSHFKILPTLRPLLDLPTWLWSSYASVL